MIDQQESFEQWFARVDARFWNNWDACNAAFHAGQKSALSAQPQFDAVPAWPKGVHDEALEVLRNVDIQFRATGQVSSRLQQVINLIAGMPKAQPRQDDVSAPPFGPLFSAVVRARTVEEEVEACRALARAVNADLDKCLNGDVAMGTTGSES